MNEIVAKPTTNITIDDMIERYKNFVEFNKRVLRNGHDYGYVPGSDKPFLLQPGAEKIATFLGLSPKFVLIDKIVDFNSGLFYFQYLCQLYNKNGDFIAEAVASCNSREKKYRYRIVPRNKATKSEIEQAVRIEQRSGRNGTYEVVVIENKEPEDLINTIDQMAQKRAFVRAVRIAANASEFYTQDTEEYLDGEINDDEAPPPATKTTGTKTDNKKSSQLPDTLQYLINNGINDVAEAARIANALKLQSVEQAANLYPKYKSHIDSGMTHDEAVKATLEAL